MRARWVVPLICYGALLAVDILVIGLMALPQTTVYVFASFYLLVPALSFCLALFLCVTETHLSSKLLFPVVALVALPLVYLLYDSQSAPVTDLGHLSADFGLALIVTFAPAVVGTFTGLVVWAFKKQQVKRALKSGAWWGSAKRSRRRRRSTVFSPPKLRVTSHGRRGGRRAASLPRVAGTATGGAAAGGAVRVTGAATTRVAVGAAAAAAGGAKTTKAAGSQRTTRAAGTAGRQPTGSRQAGRTTASGTTGSRQTGRTARTKQGNRTTHKSHNRRPR
jgi:hypothetical protein